MNCLENDNEETSNNLERIHEEKNNILIRTSKQLEIERNEKRNKKIECDKLNLKVRYFEEQLQKSKFNFESKYHEFELLF